MNQTILTAFLAAILSSSAFAMSRETISSTELLEDFGVVSSLNRNFRNTSDGKPCALRVMNSRRNPGLKFLAIAVQSIQVRNDLDLQIAPVVEEGRRAYASSILVELNQSFVTRETPISTSFEYCTRMSGESVDCSVAEAHVYKKLELIMDDIRVVRNEIGADGQVLSSQRVACSSSRQ